MSDYTTYMASLSPVAWWRLGDASGAPQDSSGNARHFTSNSGLTYGVSGALAAGESNNAISAAGAGYASIADNSALEWDYSGNFTIVFWAKWSTDQENMIISKWAAATAYPYYVRTVTSGKILWTRYDLTNSSSLSSIRAGLNDNVWHFFGLSKTGGAGGQMLMMIDGSVDNVTTDVTTTTTTNAAATRIFSRQDSAGYLTGSLDEIALFNSGLNAGQMAGLYATGKLGLWPRPVSGHNPVSNVSMGQIARIIQ